MNRRDNMMAILNHESHDHVGCWFDVAGMGGDLEDFENGPVGGTGGLDGFGMEWSRTASGFGGGTPSPDKIVLPDVTEWKKYVKFPDVTKYDWEGQAKAQLAKADRNNQVVEYNCWNGPFLRLVDLMSMVEGLVAFYEEPEACTDLMNAIMDYRISTLEYIKKYFDPDSVCIYDDFAHERGLFISPEIYKELIAPMHKRWTEAVRSYGMIPNMHTCGKCEQVVDYFPEEGFAAWEIAAPENDLVSLGKKVGDKLAFFGAIDLQAKWVKPGDVVTEEQLRAKARETVDLYAPAGNLAIMGCIFNPAVDIGLSVMAMNSEVISYGSNYYCK